jgi:hypothetical protein
LQKPSVPQVDAALIVHSLSGSVPLLIARHSPLPWPVFVLAHAWQLPAHADSQQKPSTQKPLVHSFDPPQAAPFPFSGTHTPAEQKWPDVQSALEPHDVLHEVAPQTYGTQDVLLTVWQLPDPLQVRAGV